MSELDYAPSPAPGDADLWPGELPFTSWGQYKYGELDLRVFDQDVWWVDIHQRPHRLEEMSDAYISNVIGHLEQNDEFHYLESVLRERIQAAGDLLLGRNPVSMVAEAAGAPPLSSLTPRDWIEGTPLMRALRRRAGNGEPGRGRPPPSD